MISSRLSLWHTPARRFFLIGSCGILIAAIFCFIGCADRDLKPVKGDLIIAPWPASVQPKEGFCLINRDTWIQADSFNGFSFDPMKVFMDVFERKSGYRIPVVSSGKEKRDTRRLILIIRSPVQDNPEGYRLSIKPYGMIISASTEQGLFYAFQTLRQIMRLDVLPDVGSGHREWSVPVVDILDQPEFPYRGMHLDVSRHFMPTDFIKKYIDLLAYYKMNRFHWHLTDDQGWRIEIRKYPRLQEVAAWRDETLVGHYREEPDVYDGKKYGGYYTRDEIRDIVAYAADRGVMIIPEIEMPGHALAALAAYPELACTPGPFEVAKTWGVFEDVFCPTEETFTFLQNVLEEVIALFPSPYIHIGGDECPKTRWKESAFCQERIRTLGLKDEYELQSYFIRRIESFLNSKGKKIIGWDEILEGGLAPNATVMSWRGMEGGIEAARAGHDVIMTPGSHCYFDYYQFDPAHEPLAIGGLITLEKVYAFSPVPDELSEKEARHILGAQGNLWTEYIPGPAQAEYMAFPRAIALAEVLWTPVSKRRWSDFVLRLHGHKERLTGMEVRFADHLTMPSVETLATAEGLQLAWKTYLPRQTIFFVRDTTQHVWGTAMSGDTVLLKDEGTYYYKTDDSPVRKIWYRPSRSKSAVFHATPSPDPKYPGRQGLITLSDGLVGSDDFNGQDWCAWQGGAPEITITFEQPVPVDSVVIGLLSGESSWIHVPSGVEVYVARKQGHFEKWSVWTPSVSRAGRNEAAIPVREEGVYGIRLNIIPLNPIPEGFPGAGKPAWTFIDEIRVF